MKAALPKLAMLVAILFVAAPVAALGEFAIPATPTVPIATGSGGGGPVSPTEALSLPPAPSAPLEDAAAPAPETLGPDAPMLPDAPVALPPFLTEYVVGYDQSFPAGLIAALGGTVRSTDPVLGFAVVALPSADVLLALVGMDPTLAYVERNGALFQEGAQWDAATWDGAQWDASQWDASQWDASQWDAAQWDASQWDASQWDASQWDASQWDAAQWDGEPTMDPGFPVQWNLGAIHAPDAWASTTGYHKRTICVADSGIDATHVDLAANVKRLGDGSFGYDFVNSDKDPSDDGGHGTHVAGIAAGVMANGHGIAGVSQSWLIAAKVLNATGSGSEANLASAIRWCADNGGNVILLALHTEQDNRAVKDAVSYATGRGSLIVAASGNAGQTCKECVAFPAAYAKVLAVGASAPNSTVASFSNGGDKLDLVAPGVAIAGPAPGNSYAIGSGTSQATAVAAGAAALLWAERTSMNADAVRGMLTDTAKDDGTLGFDYIYGYGHLRLDRAFQALYNT